MLKKEEKELLDLLLSKKTIPYCMGKYNFDCNTCNHCGFNEICYVVEKEQLDDYIIENKQLTNKQLFISQTINVKEFVSKIKSLVKELKNTGLGDDKIIEEVINAGYKISDKNTFKRCYL